MVRAPLMVEITECSNLTMAGLRCCDLGKVLVENFPCLLALLVVKMLFASSNDDFEADPNTIDVLVRKLHG